MMNNSGQPLSSLQIGATLFDCEGNAAQIISMEQSGTDTYFVLRRADKSVVSIPAAEASRTDADSGCLVLSFKSLEQLEHSTYTASTVVPVMREELNIEKRKVQTGRGLRLTKTISTREETIDEPLMHDEISVTRIPVGRLLDAHELPATRVEGETTIIPVVEEVMVVEKRWRVKEEIHITRNVRTVQSSQKVELREEQISIKRFDDTNDNV